ncbi:hypothetical protein [Pseudoflavonifractor phocaeensis]|uniref:hypothetical protein n=1 Tax=Pseudoflavonifractor phocaeensis TaxID=1870988 RepID=UPI00195C7E25|nr:hypothetical protein [Pseudoflavonifractor phocaeensis]MBM6887630.1 hypothetical protein [Pseudoflavonifractor phocaeensis]
MEGRYKTCARVVAKAIRTLASKPDNLENLENYLSHNFGEWVEKYARYPETLAAELQNFANMDI